MQFIVSPKKTTAPSKSVVFYAQKGFEGADHELGPGLYHIRQLYTGSDRKNTIGSLQIPDDYIVVLYEKANYQGKHKTFGMDIDDVTIDFEVSAFAVQPAIRLFSENNYRGSRQFLPSGRYRVSALTDMGGGLPASIKIPKDLQVILFQEDNFQGEREVLNEDTDSLDERCRFNAASLMVVPRPKGMNMDAVAFGDSVAFRQFNGEFISIIADGGLQAVSEFIGEPQRFTMVRSGSSRHDQFLCFGDIISLRSVDGRYLGVTKDGDFSITGNVIEKAQQFILYRSGKTHHNAAANNGDVISLKSCLNDRYVGIDEQKKLYSKSTEIYDEERWILIIDAKPNISFEP